MLGRLPLKLVKACFESVNHNILNKVCVIQVCVTSKKNLTAHAISCGHAKFCCVRMSSILRAKTLKQPASARDKSEEVEIHGWKNAQSLIVTVLCLLQSTHVVMNITQFVVDSCDINLRKTLTFETNVECSFTGLLYLYKVNDRLVCTTQVMIGSCHFNIFLSELFC